MTPPGPMWTMDCLFAIGANFTGTGTKFMVTLLHNDVTGSGVSVGVNNSGQFGIYNGGTFTTLPTLGTVAFSVTNNSGTFTEPGATLNVYHLRIVGNFTASTPYVNVYTSDANNTNLDHEVSDLTDWVGNAPVSGQSSPETILFNNYNAPPMVDAVTVNQGIPIPAPAISREYTLINGTRLVFSVTNATPGIQYYLLSSTNLATPLANWTRVSTNTFTGFTSLCSTASPTNVPQTFYLLQVP